MKEEINLDLVEVAFDWTRDIIDFYCERENIEFDCLVEDVRDCMSDKMYDDFEEYIRKGGRDISDNLCPGLRTYLARHGMDFDEIVSRPTSIGDEKSITSEERNVVMSWLSECFGHHKFEQDFRHSYEDMKEEESKEEADE